MLFVASEPLSDKVTGKRQRLHVPPARFHLRMQTTMLVPEAAKLNKKRWGIVYPNYEYGQSAANSFKEAADRGATGRRRGVCRAGSAAWQD